MPRYQHFYLLFLDPGVFPQTRPGRERSRTLWLLNCCASNSRTPILCSAELLVQSRCDVGVLLLQECEAEDERQEHNQSCLAVLEIPAAAQCHHPWRPSGRHTSRISISPLAPSPGLVGFPCMAEGQLSLHLFILHGSFSWPGVGTALIFKRWPGSEAWLPRMLSALVSIGRHFRAASVGQHIFGRALSGVNTSAVGCLSHAASANVALSSGEALTELLRPSGTFLLCCNARLQKQG